MKNRKQAEATLLSGLQELAPGCSDIARYQALFAKWSDKEFDHFMQKLKSGEATLQITVPPGTEGKHLTIENNFKVADKWGHDFFHRLWMPAEDGQPAYLTPIKYFVCQLPVRVASQRIAKKASIPKSARSINSLTGQPTGDSKGASFSFPETRLAAAMGLVKAPVELLKYSGGDTRGQAAMSASLVRTGRASQEVLKHFASGVVSTNTLHTYLTSAMIKNNVNQK